ncbi:hypothetical protein Tco_1534048 [Tanacetum coccineum]
MVLVERIMSLEEVIGMETIEIDVVVIGPRVETNKKKGVVLVAMKRNTSLVIVDETCLMALKLQEVCLKYDILPDDWTVDSGCTKDMTDIEDWLLHTTSMMVDMSYLGVAIKERLSVEVNCMMIIAVLHLLK